MSMLDKNIISNEMSTLEGTKMNPQRRHIGACT